MSRPQRPIPALAVMFLALASAARAGDPPAPEAPPPARAEELLPPVLLRGPHHEVEDAVTTRRFHHVFHLRTDYGVREVVSRRLLEIRIHETETIAGVVGMSGAPEFFKSLGQGLASLPTAAVGIVLHPVQSVSKIGEGLGKTFGRLKDLFRSRPRSAYEDGSVEDAFLGDEKRKLASDLHLDVYSTNPQVQYFLDRIARARAAGNLSIDAASLALPVVGFVAVTATKWQADVDRLLRDHTPAELDRHNAAALEGLGVGRLSWGPFLTNPHLSPRHRTVITAATKQIEGAANLRALPDAAATAEGELGALFQEQQATLLAWHHEHEGPIASLVRIHHLVAARTAEGGTVMYLPADTVYWTDGLAQLVAQVRLALPEGPLELRVTGRVTPGVVEALAAKGIATTPQFEVPSPPRAAQIPPTATPTPAPSPAPAPAPAPAPTPGGVKPLPRPQPPDR